MKLPQPPAPHDGVLDGLAVDASRLVASAAGFALALDQIGIDLPPLNAARVDQAQLRAIASLYLAAELETTGLISVGGARWPAWCGTGARRSMWARPRRSWYGSGRSAPTAPRARSASTVSTACSA